VFEAGERAGDYIWGGTRAKAKGVGRPPVAELGLSPRPSAWAEQEEGRHYEACKGSIG
jgi:hypothetical protein